jgi:phenylalanyl-tRNA synthetase alpha chain
MAASSLTSEQLQLTILKQLDVESGTITDTRELQLPSGSAAGSSHAEQMAVKAALDSLLAKEMVEFTQKQIDSLELSPEGLQMVEQGSHELRVWTALKEEQETSAKELQEQLGKEVATVGQLNAFKEKWIKKQGNGFVRAVSGRGSERLGMFA